jgi:DNA end-binding protein Ku
MMPRASWKGLLRLSLVSCPVFLTPATVRTKPIRLHRVWAPRTRTPAPQTKIEEEEPAPPIAVRREAEPPQVAPLRAVAERRRQPSTAAADDQEPVVVSRVAMRAHDPTTGDELDAGEVAHGYEIERGRYVTLTKEELQALAPERSTVLDLASFVPAAELDPLFFDTSYYLHPDGSAATEPYRVIAAAMERGEVVAVTSIVLTRREHMAIVAPRNGGMMLTTLRSAEEVRAAEFRLPDDELDPEMVEIAEAILRRRAGHFDPATIRDKYQDALRELVEAKAKGLPAKPSAPIPAPSGVVDLMAALKQSLARESDIAPKAKRSTTPDRRQRALLLPMSGAGGTSGRSRKPAAVRRKGG